MQARSKSPQESIPETPRSRLWRQISRAMREYLKQSDNP